MSDNQNTAQDMIDDLRPAAPTRQASDLLNAEKMQREAERLARQQAEAIRQANAGGGPHLR